MPPVVCQGRHANDNLSEDGFTIVSSQVRFEGGPSMRNVEFNLGVQAGRAPAVALQWDVNKASFWTREGDYMSASSTLVPPPSHPRRDHAPHKDREGQ